MSRLDLTEESPVADTVKLISAEGFEFIIDRKCAMASGTIKNMLSSPGLFRGSEQSTAGVVGLGLE
jgi:hypothetical protein